MSERAREKLRKREGEHETSKKDSRNRLMEWFRIMDAKHTKFTDGMHFNGDN